MPNILNKLRNSSIYFKLSVIISLLFLAMFFITVFNFVLYSSEKMNSIQNMVSQTNNQALNEIDNHIKDISNITKIPLTYKKYNNTSFLKQIEEFNISNSSTLSFQITSEQMFEDIFAYKSDLDSCYLFNLEGNGVFKSRTPIHQIDNPVNKKWFQDSIDAFGKPVIVDTYRLPNVMNRKEPIYVFGVARGIVRFESSKVVGVLKVNTKVDYLDNICTDMKLSEGHRFVILHDNYVIYDTAKVSLASAASDELTDIDWSANEHQTLTIDDKKYLVSSILSDYSGWRMISLIPYNEIFSDLQRMQTTTVILSIIIISISLYFVYIAASNIVRPIRRLVALMKLAENGDLDVKINISSENEIGILSRSFNSLISKINTLIQEVYIKQIEKNEIELQMLQSQINPHFIYNTLESISMMATINQDDITSEMASNLGSILRYGINKTQTEVTVEDEIHNLKKYIALQEIRFNSAYTFIINIDPDIHLVPIIKLILQPIVENAIYHGMNSIRSGGKIIINGYSPDKKILIFEVIDNGIGMSEEQTKDLNDYINDKNNLYKSIGLRNVNKRIKLRYGDIYGIVIESSLEKGTMVSIKLPIQRK